MSERRFPVLYNHREGKLYQDLGVPRSVPWTIVAPHEDQAEDNHDQSLKTLARRGGLDVAELALVLTDRSLRQIHELTTGQADQIVLDAIAEYDQQERLDKK